LKIFLCKGSFFGPVSGADQMIVNYALHLKAAGHEPHVIITVPFARDDQYLKRLTAAGIPVVALGRLTSYRARLVVRRLALALPFLKFLEKYRDWEAAVYRTAVAYLRAQRPDVLHVIAEGGLYIRAAHAAGVPVVYQEPAMPFYGDAPEVKVSYEKLSASLPLASELVAVSPRIAQLCRERLNCPEHVSVVPILVDDPALAVASSKTHETVTFGFAARIEALKGPMVLLEAFARLSPELPNVRLIIAGSGDQDAEIGQRARDLGVTDRCLFPGPYVDEAGKRAFMESIDVLVHPSLFEGTPCTVIEAMAFGLPVIASEVGGVPDMLTAESGVLVPPSDVDALAAAMRELAYDPERRTALGLAARARYETVFAPSAVLPLLLGKYQGAIDRHHGTSPTNSPSSPHPWAETRA
jgi:glycosyltransferase involved in cell wall biosynthesis